MDITSETAIQTERRLRAVLAAATRVVEEGIWHYEEFLAARFETEVRSDALALIRKGDNWSQLVPVLAGESVSEPLSLWRVSFAPGSPNSGFVGWLASTIKREIGAGVIVVCGYDAQDGGVYDYWGCPLAAGEQALALIAALAEPLPSSKEDAIDLDGCLMNATQTAENGVVGHDTLFHFRQNGERVWAEYAGGALAAGYLVGTARGAHLEFRYCQSDRAGGLDGGHSTCVLERLPDGRRQIREQFQWASRPGGGENVITELLAQPR